MSVRALLRVVAALAVATPLHVQTPGDCWSLRMSDWEWRSYRGDPGAPSYPPSESAVRFVPEVFQLTDSVLIEAQSHGNPGWRRIESVVAAPDPRPGYWQVGPSFLGLRVTWSETGRFFEAFFPDYSPDLDSIVGLGGEEPDPGFTHHDIPSWGGVATLVRRDCSAAGAR